MVLPQEPKLSGQKLSKLSAGWVEGLHWYTGIPERRVETVSGRMFLDGC